MRIYPKRITFILMVQIFVCNLALSGNFNQIIIRKVSKGNSLNEGYFFYDFKAREFELLNCGGYSPLFKGYKTPRGKYIYFNAYKPRHRLLLDITSKTCFEIPVTPWIWDSEGKHFASVKEVYRKSWLRIHNSRGEVLEEHLLPRGLEDSGNDEFMYKLISFYRNNSRIIMIVVNRANWKRYMGFLDLGTSEFFKMIPTAPPGRSFSNIHLSPNEDLLSFGDPYDLYLMDMIGTGQNIRKIYTETRNNMITSRFR